MTARSMPVRIQPLPKTLRCLAASLVLAAGLATAPVPGYAQSNDTAAESQDVHPAIAEADAAREEEAERKRYLLVFPAVVVGITVALLIATRRRKK